MKSIDIGDSGLTGSKVVEKLGTHGHQAVAASPNSGVNTMTEHEAAQVERANASSATPVVFVHGLWLLPSRVAIRSYERVSGFAAAVFMFLNFLSELNGVTT